jgi:formylglycine-generating enzyme required for sulfatase activity
MIRGGGWDSAETELHSTNVFKQDPTTADSDVGVRCVKTRL